MRSFPMFRVRNIVLSALCVLIVAAQAFSQEDGRKPSIAVIPFAESGNAKYGGAELADLLLGELAASNRFVIVDKAKANPTETETELSSKDVLDPAVAAEIGRKAGAKFIVVGSLTEYTEKVKVTMTGVKSFDAAVKFNLREIDTATGEVVLSKTFEKRGVSMGEVKNPSGTFASKAMQDAVNKSIKDAAAELIRTSGTK